MYHVTITEDGKPLREIDCKVILGVFTVSVADGTECVACTNGANGLEMLQTLVSIDELEESVMKDNPMLALAYLAKDELIKGHRKVDLTALDNLLEDYQK